MVSLDVHPFFYYCGKWMLLLPSSPDTLAVLARTVGKEVFSPLAAECVQLGLNLSDAVDDPDVRRCT